MFGDIFDGDVQKERKDVAYGPYSFSLVCVSGENQHIDKWVPLVIWRAAEAFNEELTRPERVAELKGKRVVELGSGTGMCGLLAAKINGSTTLLTDGSEDSIAALEESIALNDFAASKQIVECSLLMWGDVAAATELTEKYGLFEICLATDVIYEAAAVKPLLVSASALLKPGGTFYLANHRFRFHGLRREIESAIPDVPLTLLSCTRVGEDVDLYVFKRNT
jgi:hypothetical protein